MIVLPVPSIPDIPIEVAAIDDIVVAVAVSIPKCPRPTIKDAVKDVLRDWCQTTWDTTKRFLLSGIPAEVWDIDFSGMLSGMEIFRVAGLWSGGRKIPVQEGGADKGMGFRVSGDHLFLFPVGGTDYEMEVVLQPPWGGSSFPSQMQRQWKQAIVSGAKSHLMAMADKPWSNPQASAYHSVIYTNARGQVVGQNARKYTTSGKGFV